MPVEQMLPRARQRLAVIEVEAPVMEAAALMSKPDTDLVVVCDRGDMVGVLTKTDIVGQIGRCMGSACTVTRAAPSTAPVVKYHALLESDLPTKDQRWRNYSRCPIVKTPSDIVIAVA